MATRLPNIKIMPAPNRLGRKPQMERIMSRIGVAMVEAPRAEKMPGTNSSITNR